MNTIHPTAVIEGDVILGDGNVIGPFVVVTGPVVIGDGNWFGAGVVLGAPPEVRSFPHPGQTQRPSGLETEGPPSVARGLMIGSGCVIREYAQLHQGWHEPTTIGDDAFIMNQAYIAHDTVLGARVTLAGGVRLAGHVQVGDGANLGLGSMVHQRRRIGAGSMVGMGAVVTRDVPAFAKVYGNPARVHGINRRGAEAAGLEADRIDQLVEYFADRSSG